MLENLKNLTVVYVEDDKLTRQLIKQALNHLVKKVYLAKNGQEGLKLYKLVQPDIVLTDMHMPIMSGIEMCQKIKDIQPTQSIGIFTGDSINNKNKELDTLNIDTYLVKPLNRRQFFNALSHLGELSLVQ